MVGNIPLLSSDDQEIENFQVEAGNLEAVQASERLKEAIRFGGGNAAVAKRAGIALGTINNYIAGRDMKTSYMVALAKACGVNVAWLAAGEGPMTGSTGEPQETAPVKAFRDLKVDLMAEALEAARKMFADAKAKPTTRELVQVAFLTYDTLNQQR